MVMNHSVRFSVIIIRPICGYHRFSYLCVFSLYSFFTMLIMVPLHNPKQYGHQYAKGFTKNHRNIMIIFVGVMAAVASLIVFDQSVKIVSVLIGIVSMIIAIAYTSMAYRCLEFLTKMSRQMASTRIIHTSVTSYDHNHRQVHLFELCVLAPALCSQFLYFSSSVQVGRIYP